MATHHAAAGEVVDLERWADELSSEHSKAVFRTEALELARLVVGAGEQMHAHRPCSVKGDIVIHCLSGLIALRIDGADATLKAGELVWLEGGTEHAVSGIEDSVVLLTITFP